MQTLIIKGGTQDAFEAAQERGVAIYVHQHLEKWNETIVTAEDSDIERIRTWFSSPASHSSPFPAGTLLWFGERARAPGAYLEAMPKPKPKTRPAYLATVQVLIDVDSFGEACDAMAEALRENMRKYSNAGCFLDWRYLPHSAPEVVQLPAEFKPDDDWPAALSV